MADKKDPQGSGNGGGNPWMKSLAIWLGILLAIVLFVSMFEGGKAGGQGESIAYSEFLSRVNDGSVKEAEIGNGFIVGKYTTGAAFKTNAPSDPLLVQRLEQKGVTFRARPEEQPSVWSYLLYQSVPFLILLGVGYFIMRQMQKNAGSGAMGFGKSKAKLLTEKQGRVTFDDVAGIDEAREELQEIVDFLKDPGKFAASWRQDPQGRAAGRLGPPGTGKTLLARAIAGEAKVPFFTISGSDFVEMFVGVGASPRARHV